MYIYMCVCVCFACVLCMYVHLIKNPQFQKYFFGDTSPFGSLCHLNRIQLLHQYTMQKGNLIGKHLLLTRVKTECKFYLM